MLQASQSGVETSKTDPLEEDLAWVMKDSDDVTVGQSADEQRARYSTGYIGGESVSQSLESGDTDKAPLSQSSDGHCSTDMVQTRHVTVSCPTDDSSVRRVSTDTTLSGDSQMQGGGLGLCASCSSCRSSIQRPAADPGPQSIKRFSRSSTWAASGARRRVTVNVDEGVPSERRFSRTTMSPAIDVVPAPRRERSSSFALNSVADAQALQAKLKDMTSNNTSIHNIKKGSLRNFTLPGFTSHTDEVGKCELPDEQLQEEDSSERSSFSSSGDGEQKEDLGTKGSITSSYSAEFDVVNDKGEMRLKSCTRTSIKELELSQEPVRHPWIFTASADMLFGGLILVNIVCFHLETDKVGGLPATVWQVVESVLVLAFATELGMRFAWRAQQPVELDEDPEPFLYSPWNLLDILVVGIGLLDTWILTNFLKGVLGVSVESQEGVLGLFSIFRMLRLFRLLRILRLFRFSKELLLLAQGIAAAVRGLWWVVLLVLLTLYTCSIFTTQMIGQEDLGNQQVKDYFGSVHESMFTLFQLMTLENWGEIARMHKRLIAWTPLFFVSFIFFTNFILLNLITGVILEKVLATARREEEKALQKEEKDKMQKVERINQLFRAVLGDLNSENELSIEQFRQACRNPRFLKQLQNLQIATYDAEELFVLMDTAKRGVINVDRFIQGCLRVHGAARAKHLLGVQFDVQKVWWKLSDQMDEMEDRLSDKMRQTMEDMSLEMQSAVTEMAVEKMQDVLQETLQETLQDVFEEAWKEALQEAAKKAVPQAMTQASREVVEQVLHQQIHEATKPRMTANEESVISESQCGRNLGTPLERDADAANPEPAQDKVLVSSPQFVEQHRQGKSGQHPSEVDRPVDNGAPESTRKTRGLLQPTQEQTVPANVHNARRRRSAESPSSHRNHTENQVLHRRRSEADTRIHRQLQETCAHRRIHGRRGTDDGQESASLPFSGRRGARGCPATTNSRATQAAARLLALQREEESHGRRIGSELAHLARLLGSDEDVAEVTASRSFRSRRSSRLHGDETEDWAKPAVTTDKQESWERGRPAINAWSR